MCVFTITLLVVLVVSRRCFASCCLFVRFILVFQWLHKSLCNRKKGKREKISFAFCLL